MARSHSGWNCTPKVRAPTANAWCGVARRRREQHRRPAAARRCRSASGRRARRRAPARSGVARPASVSASGRRRRSRARRRAYTRAPSPRARSCAPRQMPTVGAAGARRGGEQRGFAVERGLVRRHRRRRARARDRSRRRRARAARSPAHVRTSSMLHAAVGQRGADQPGPSCSACSTTSARMSAFYHAFGGGLIAPRIT